MDSLWNFDPSLMYERYRGGLFLFHGEVLRQLLRKSTGCRHTVTTMFVCQDTAVAAAIGEPPPRHAGQAARTSSSLHHHTPFKPVKLFRVLCE